VFSGTVQRILDVDGARCAEIVINAVTQHGRRVASGSALVKL
jgi:hypothetical protein